MKRFSHLFLTCILALGCSGQSDPGTGGEDTSGAKNDQINSFDDPDSLIPGAKRLLKDNIVAADVGKTFGTPDDDTPYPDTYWPFVDEGIDNNWSGDETGSPLEKYMTLFDAGHKDEAKKWEKKNHGSQVPDVADWFGHCPGWTGAAMDNAPLKHAINVMPDGDGGVKKCKEGSEGCIKLEIGDINALQAEVYVDGDSSFIGARCDTKPKDIKRDRNGRIIRNGSGCQGLNPGALLIVMGNVMKHGKKAFAIDAQNDFNTDQIWNQPAYRYHVYKFESLSEKEAANLVAFGKKTGTRVHYTWNTNAKGWALVDFGLNWVSEMGPNTDVVSGKQSTKETRMVAVIELSDKASSESAEIIGGEYLNDTSVGASRLSVPPFVWMIRGAGPEELPTSVGGDNHNPYVKPSLVAQLITLAQE